MMHTCFLEHTSIVKRFNILEIKITKKGIDLGKNIPFVQCRDDRVETYTIQNLYWTKLYNIKYFWKNV